MGSFTRRDGERNLIPSGRGETGGWWGPWVLLVLGCGAGALLRAAVTTPAPACPDRAGLARAGVLGGSKAGAELRIELMMRKGFMGTMLATHTCVSVAPARSPRGAAGTCKQAHVGVCSKRAQQGAWSVMHSAGNIHTCRAWVAQTNLESPPASVGPPQLVPSHDALPAPPAEQDLIAMKWIKWDRING